jgi:hypothetical protein
VFRSSRRSKTWASTLALALGLEAAACGMGPMAGGAAATPREAPAATMVPAPEPVVASPASPPAPPPPPGSPTTLHEATVRAPHSAAMLIYTANLSMAVFQVTDAMDAVEQIGRQMGGYLSSRSDAAVTIRVQRDRFQDSLSLIERLGDVTHRDIKAEDVTDEFVDLTARLKNAYALRDRLTELLAKAQVKEAIEIQKELGKVTEEIERVEGKLKLLKDQIAFSTITVSFSPVQDQTVRDTTLLAPFPWLEKLGLRSLLDVHQ